MLNSGATPQYVEGDGVEMVDGVIVKYHALSGAKRAEGYQSLVLTNGKNRKVKRFEGFECMVYDSFLLGDKLALEHICNKGNHSFVARAASA